MSTTGRNSFDEMVTRADDGYDVDEIVRRRGRRRSPGSSPSSVQSARLNPELRRDLLLRVAEQGISR